LPYSSGVGVVPEHLLKYGNLFWKMLF